MPKTKDQLKEKLAAIEHERWGDWMTYLYEQGDWNDNGSFTINPQSAERWLGLISKPYSQLTPKQRASDLEQVDRYWPLIMEWVESLVNEVIGESEPLDGAEELARNALRYEQRQRLDQIKANLKQ